jgi:hypothetical protein
MPDQPKHTPGPWGHNADTPTFDGATLDVAIFIGHGSGKGGEIAMLRHDPGDGLDVTTEESKANARLIAVSPSYFEAVEQMLAYEDAGGDGWWKGWEMLKAAHARAAAQPQPLRDDERAEVLKSASST